MDADIRMLVVEAESWEHQEFMNRCGKDIAVFARPVKLEGVPEADIPAGINVLSTFVHSRVRQEQLDPLPDLKLIATRSTGYDHIDANYCMQRGITVCNVPQYGENTVAEHTFAMLLALTRRVIQAYERAIRGDFNVQGLRGTDIAGKTLGVLGTGRIGLRVLGIGAGFGMKLIACDVHPDHHAASNIGFDYVSLEELLSRSEVLSIHVPYNSKTHHMINSEALSKLPRGAIIVNTSRGGLIEPQALINALMSGHLGGAALDVLEGEAAIGEEAEILSSSYDIETLRTIVRNHALLRMPNVIITPHVAFNSVQAVERLVETTIDNVRAYFAGRPQNVVLGRREIEVGADI